MSIYLQKAQEEPMQREILEAVQKISFNTTQHHHRVDKNFTIVKASIENQSMPLSSSSHFGNAIKPRSYTSLLQEISPTATSSIPPKPVINKDLEIVVRLNSPEQKIALKDVSTDVILQNLNTRIGKMGQPPVRAIKRLPSGDFAILTVGSKEAEKLQTENGWTEILGKNARIVTKTYGLMINGVRIAAFNMANKDPAIEYIKTSNADIEALKEMEIRYIGWRAIPKKDKNWHRWSLNFQRQNTQMQHWIIIF